jgi:hypothetical protein
MLTIMWNRLGFRAIAKLPDDVTMNANYFAQNILGPLEEKNIPGWKGGAWMATCRVFGQRSRS